MTGTWMDKGIRDEVDMAQFAAPDPRDAEIAALRFGVDVANQLAAGYWQAQDDALARIAQLEAALRLIKTETERHKTSPWTWLRVIGDIAAGALVPSPEGDMTMSVEELGA